MEIYIQFRNTLFSIGSKGFRKMDTFDWAKFTNKFEHLFEVQHENVQRKAGELLEAEKELKIQNAGSWRRLDDITLPFDEEVDGNGA